MHRLVSIQEVVKGFRSRPIRRNESNGGNVTIERRTRQRFPLNLELRFTASMSRRSPVNGRGEVVNLSSRGVAFRTETPLTPGLSIEASMEWPVTLNGDCVLRVTLEGQVVRVQNGLSVMSVARYEFRTNGRVGTPAASDLAALKQRIGSLLVPNSAASPQCV